MSDNSTLPATGSVIRSIDRAGVQTQVAALDIGGTGGESLLGADNPMPAALAPAQFAELQRDMLALRAVLNTLSKLTYTLNGLRVEPNGGVITTITTVANANNVSMGRLTADGQSIMLSQLNAQSFRANLI